MRCANVDSAPRVAGLDRGADAVAGPGADRSADRTAKQDAEDVSRGGVLARGRARGRAASEVMARDGTEGTAGEDPTDRERGAARLDADELDLRLGPVGVRGPARDDLGVGQACAAHAAEAIHGRIALDADRANAGDLDKRLAPAPLQMRDSRYAFHLMPRHAQLALITAGERDDDEDGPHARTLTRATAIARAVHAILTSYFLGAAGGVIERVMPNLSS